MVLDINEWWGADPEERFWLEITDRDDLGANLFAPTVGDTGKQFWGYELVQYPQAGDIVFHWHKSLLGEPALVGWSIASGIVEDAEMIWYSPAVGPLGEQAMANRPAWRMPLMGYTNLPEPYTVTELADYEDAVRAAKAEVEESHLGRLYFPFALSGRRPIRPAQTYLAKMPKAVVAALDLDFDFASGPTAPRRPGPRKPAKKSEAGLIVDSVIRSAIEWRAVDVATEWYEHHDFVVTYTGDGEPYDLEVSKGSMVRRVEVKGSSAGASKVTLTSNEVENAKSYQPTDLFIVSGILYWRTEAGDIETDGGVSRRWADWSPENSALTITEYRYIVPAGGEADL